MRRRCQRAHSTTRAWLSITKCPWNISTLFRNSSLHNSPTLHLLLGRKADAHLQLAQMEEGLDDPKCEHHIRAAKQSYERALCAASGDGVPRSLYLFIVQDACSMRCNVLGESKSARELAQEVYGNYHPAAMDMNEEEVGTLDNIRQFLLVIK